MNHSRPHFPHRCYKMPSDCNAYTSLLQEAHYMQNTISLSDDFHYQSTAAHNKANQIFFFFAALILKWHKWHKCGVCSLMKSFCTDYFSFFAFTSEMHYSAMSSLLWRLITRPKWLALIVSWGYSRDGEVASQALIVQTTSHSCLHHILLQIYAADCRYNLVASFIALASSPMPDQSVLSKS